MKRLYYSLLALLFAATGCVAKPNIPSPSLADQDNGMRLASECTEQAMRSGLGSGPGTIIFLSHYSAALKQCFVLRVITGEGQSVYVWDANDGRQYLFCEASSTVYDRACVDRSEPFSPSDLSGHIAKYMEG